MKLNCHLCAICNDANKGRIWKQNEMAADHIAVYGKGGATDIKNC